MFARDGGGGGGDVQADGVGEVARCVGSSMDPPCTHRV